MIRALLHIGLAAAIAFAPVLCCCKAGLFGQPAKVAEGTHAAPLPVNVPVESCGLNSKKSCCHKSQDAPQPTAPQNHESKQPTAPSDCACCTERPDVAKTESQPVVPAAEPTGELLPFVHASHATGSPEHLGQFRGLPPPGWTSVDVRFAALFKRHVLRC